MLNKKLGRRKDGRWGGSMGKWWGGGAEKVLGLCPSSSKLLDDLFSCSLTGLEYAQIATKTTGANQMTCGGIIKEAP